MPERLAALTEGQLIEPAIAAVRSVQEAVSQTVRQLETDPAAVAEQFLRIEAHGAVKSKALLAIDRAAEHTCRKMYAAQFPDLINFAGEESLPTFAGWDDHRWCVLADMIDGTDMMEMGLSGLWCSAVAIYDRVERRIVATVVGLGPDLVYFAQHTLPGATVRIGALNNYAVQGCSGATTLEEARIAYYGQKAKNILPILGHKALQQKLTDIANLGDEARTRIFNFAGNSMMVKLANRPKGPNEEVITGGIDAVFEFAGQQVHDVVPGAYIALKAGAYMCDLRGNIIDTAGLGKLMENPSQRITYVIAATRALAEGILKAYSEG